MIFSVHARGAHILSIIYMSPLYTSGILYFIFYDDFFELLKIKSFIFITYLLEWNNIHYDCIHNQEDNEIFA